VRIHPFFDGNGRLARLIANLPLLKCGWPPLLKKHTNRPEGEIQLREANLKELQLLHFIIRLKTILTQSGPVSKLSRQKDTFHEPKQVS
jgi:Fic family protein